MLRNHLIKGAGGNPVKVIDSYIDYNAGNTASTAIDPTGGSSPLLLLTLSRRFVFGTPSATVTSTADSYTSIDTYSSGVFSAYGGGMINVLELANVVDSSSITASISNSGGTFADTNTLAAVLLDNLTASATINDVTINTSSNSTITETIDVVKNGILIILAEDNATQAVTESGSSLLGAVTQTASDGGRVLYYANVEDTGTATIESIITGGSFEGLILISIAP